MSENREFLGVWIPRELWLNKELTLQEKCLFIEIQSLDNEQHCWANNQYFAEFFNLSKSRVSQILGSLAQKGYISISVYEGSGNKRTIQTLVTYVLKTPKEGSLGFAYTPLGNAATSTQKLKHSNISSNTVSNTKEEESIKEKPLPGEGNTINTSPSQDILPSSPTKEVTVNNGDVKIGRPSVPRSIPGPLINPWDIFIPAYGLYPGIKGAEGAMFACFRKGCKLASLNEASEVFRLSPAIKFQIAWRTKKKALKQFAPEWKGFAGWLTGAHWLDILPEAVNEADPEGTLDYTSDETCRVLFDSYITDGTLPADTDFQVWSAKQLADEPAGDK